MPTIDIKGSGDVEFKSIQFSGDATVIHFKVRREDTYLIGVTGTEERTIQSVNDLLAQIPRRRIERIRPDERGSVLRNGKQGEVTFSFSAEKKLVALNWLLQL